MPILYRVNAKTEEGYPGIGYELNMGLLNRYRVG